jgi:hypothetical protein
MRLIYLSPVPWCSFTQRPHEFVDYFNKVTSGEVLWIDPYPTRLPTLADFTRFKGNNGESLRAMPEWLTVLRPSAFPLEPIPFATACNTLLWKEMVRQVCAFAKAEETGLTIGKPSALALTLLSTLDVAWTLYDAMDDFPAFYTGISRWSMARYERVITQRVSRLIASSSNLVQKFSTQSKVAALVLNACRSDLPVPKTNRQEVVRPVVGYVGTLGGWFDWEMLVHLALSRPDCDFRVIGPLFSNSKQALPSNVDIQPPLEHSASLAAMRDFDVGLIPFKKSLLTESVDPIKYYEYRAMGMPVISSAFGEMALRGEEDGVFLLGKETDTGKVVEQALECQNNDEIITRFREQNTWEKRFSEAGLFV